MLVRKRWIQRGGLVLLVGRVDEQIARRRVEIETDRDRPVVVLGHPSGVTKLGELAGIQKGLLAREIDEYKTNPSLAAQLIFKGAK